MSDGNGVLPEGWEATKIGDIAHVTSGFGFPKRLQGRSTGEVPFAKVGDVSRVVIAGRYEIDSAENYITEGELPELRAKKLPEGATVFAKIGEAIRLNRRALTARPMVVDNNVMAVIPDGETLDERFFFHFFRTVELGELANATTVPSVRKSDVVEISLGLPPLAEQRRIVGKIESLQERSSRARQALEEVRPLLEQFRQSVLRDAFSGRLTADWRAAHPDVEPASELLARIRTERRHRWEQSELTRYEAKGKKPPKNWQEKYKEPKAVARLGLEQLPEGWCWCRIKDVGQVQLGRQRSPKYHSGPNMRPYLRVMNVYEDRIDTDDVMEMDFSPDDFERYRLTDGDILLNEGQSHELVGRPAIYGGEVPGACFTNTLVRFRPDAPLTSDYPQIVFLGYLNTGRFQQIASLTVNIAHLGAGRFADMAFPLPPLGEQAEIVRQARTGLNRIKELEGMVAESESALTQLDQSILAKAFRGELVPQDPQDEPASELLARIRATREPQQKPAKRKRRKKVAD